MLVVQTEIAGPGHGLVFGKLSRIGDAERVRRWVDQPAGAPAARRSSPVSS
jgi:hypothetical protein